MSLSPSKVLVTGAKGMLGSDLVEHFRKQLPPDCLVATDRESLDIARPDSIDRALDKFQPTVVINAAAYTNVDGAETERELARILNALGPKYLTESCQKREIPLFHFSTDQVFNGRSDKAYSEEDDTDPLNYYATTKLEGEQAVLNYEKALVLRVQWLYGVQKNRFTSLRKYEVFTPFSDQFGAPTWTRRLSEVVGLLVARRASGLYHFSYDDHASWAEIFEFVKSQLDLPVKLIPKKTSEVTLPAKRPLFSVLSNEKLKRTLEKTKLGSWRTDLTEFLKLSTSSDSGH